MDIGFVGLGNMGFPMARRLLGAGYEVLVCDKRDDVVAAAVAAGARAMASPREIAEHTETVLASLPSLQASIDVATGPDGVVDGAACGGIVDLSTVGSRARDTVADALAVRDIAALDSPVSGGVAGAERARWRSWCPARERTSTKSGRCSKRSAGRSSSAKSPAPHRR